MQATHLLAKNIEALIEAGVEVKSVYGLAKVTALSQSSLGRILRSEVACQLDTVELIDGAFKIRPCDLLDPALALRIREKQPLKGIEAQPPIVDAVHWRETAPSVRALVEELLTRAQSGRLSEELVAVLQGVLRVAAQPFIENRPLGAPIAPEFQAALQEQSEHGEREQQKRAGRSLSHG